MTTLLKTNKPHQTVTTQHIKRFIKETSGPIEMNTSLPMVHELDEIVRNILRLAIISAKKDGRKTVMERDLLNVNLMIQRMLRPVEVVISQPLTREEIQQAVSKAFLPSGQ